MHLDVPRAWLLGDNLPASALTIQKLSWGGNVYPQPWPTQAPLGKGLLGSL